MPLIFGLILVGCLSGVFLLLQLLSFLIFWRKKFEYVYINWWLIGFNLISGFICFISAVAAGAIAKNVANRLAGPNSQENMKIDVSKLATESTPFIIFFVFFLIFLILFVFSTIVFANDFAIAIDTKNFELVLTSINVKLAKIAKAASQKNKLITTILYYSKPSLFDGLKRRLIKKQATTNSEQQASNNNQVLKSIFLFTNPAKRFVNEQLAPYVNQNHDVLMSSNQLENDAKQALKSKLASIEASSRNYQALKEGSEYAQIQQIATKLDFNPHLSQPELNNDLRKIIRFITSKHSTDQPFPDDLVASAETIITAIKPHPQPGFADADALKLAEYLISKNRINEDDKNNQTNVDDAL